MRGEVTMRTTPVPWHLAKRVPFQQGAAFCVLCKKTMKEGAIARYIHIINGGDDVLHPGDEAAYIPDEGDVGLHEIGNECAKKIGLEWTVKAYPNTLRH